MFNSHLEHDLLDLYNVFNFIHKLLGATSIMDRDAYTWSNDRRMAIPWLRR
jgi:hypothetical protein